MDASVNYLIKVINSEINHGLNVYNFLKEKEKILVCSDVKKLKAVVDKEHSFFVKAKELETSRFSVLEVIAKKYKIHKTNIKLLDICEKLDVQIRNKIKNLRKQLKDILHKIKNQNIKCEILIKKSMEIINFSINLMTKRMPQRRRVIYDKNCQSLNGSLDRNLIDQRG